MVDRVESVSEEAIVTAMRLVFERMKLVIEPSAAVGVAVAVGGGAAPPMRLSVTTAPSAIHPPTA